MDLRAWFVHATTGWVQAEAHLVNDSRFISMLGGGTMNAEVIISRYARPDGRPDVDVVQKILDYCTGGRHTLLLTDGTTVVGEWLIWTHKRDADKGVIPVTGFQWERYPGFRSAYREINVKNEDAGAVHRLALDDAFNSFQPGAETVVSVPPQTFGQRITIKIPTRTTYYGDIVKDLDDLGAAEWRVVPTTNWADGTPLRVRRAVQYARPRFNTAHPDRLVKAGTGARGGNVTGLVRDNNYSRIAQTVIGWGAGKGAKKRFAMAQEFGWTERGYLATTKNVNFDGEYSNAQLATKTQAELAASQDAWEPTQITVDTRRMGQLPEVGGRHALAVGASWTFPSEWETNVRVGSIEYRTGTPLIGLEVEEV